MRASTAIHAGRILVADDQPCHLSPVESILAQAGYDVVTAVNGREVLDKAAAFAPDLFLLDVNMPELDGFEACSCLKDDPDFQDVPVIFMSAEDDIHAVECAFELGGSDFLAKPFNRSEMLVRIRSHLRAYHVRKGFRYQLLEEARQLANVATLCVSLARTLKDQNRTVASDESIHLAIPDVATCLADNAEILARGIEQLLGRDNLGFLRELHLRDFTRHTSSSDVLSFLGGAYLRAKRRGISLTMPRRPDAFRLDAIPHDIKKLLDGLSDFYLDQLPRGARCQVSTRRRDPNQICLTFHAQIAEMDDKTLPGGFSAGCADLPDELAELAARITADVMMTRNPTNALQLTIALPMDFHSAS